MNMIFCDKHFEVEFLKIERWVKFIGIPFFTLMSTLFITEYPFYLEQHLVKHIVFSFLGVLGIWYSVRVTSNFMRKNCIRLIFAFRIIIQLVLTSIISIIITVGLHYFGMKYFELLCANCIEDILEFKNLLLTVVLLTFLINTIYESFFLFNQLSETALETERYKKESIEAQYQNLTSRLNPHFLFNSLNTLTTVVEEDPKKAVNYIRELSVVYRYVLNSQRAAWSDLTAEMKFTQSYILLLKMRFEENLRISLDICESHQNYHILPMTIQLLIENAVKHNEISDIHPLEIKIYCEEEMLVVSNKKQIRNIMPSTTKVGLHNISERYRFLVNKEVIIEDKDDSFTVKIPLVKTLGKDIDHITDEEYQ
jgi:two-component system, LytTR family, sensor kinase